MELKTPSNNGQSSNPEPKLEPPNPSNGETHKTDESHIFFEDIDSTCSTPYVSAPSSPGRSGPVSGFFYSAPASPMHFALTSKSSSFASPQGSSSSFDNTSVSLGFEFEFSARFGSSGSGPTGPMSSADELFLNGKIRPMKLSTHLEKPQALAPLLDLESENEEHEAELEFEPVRGRDLRFRDKSLRRRTRSMSPLRNVPFEWAQSEIETDEKGCSFVQDLKGGGLKESKNEGEEEEEEEEVESTTTTPSVSASTSRSSSAGRNSKRWIFLKDFLHRSKSEGRSNHKFWSSISFSTAKEKKPTKQSAQTQGSVSKDPKFSNPLNLSSEAQKSKGSGSSGAGKKPVTGKPTNGVGKRRMPPSLHELHYTANRAQAEEMRKKTYLPYRQGLLGCLGFSSKGYGAAMSNGFARALNPVSSR
ncbi:uncharacterized protein LOC110762889 [Prunus avium]|uniref:Uncharacterized protein LOC110762889 n=1 Tax=Prunus avium TaxID=42229 RepID=A0A6P5T2L1_PRUAV|nr:uncharacterized protein LOC110762889 [Prunus avium]